MPVNRTAPVAPVVGDDPTLTHGSGVPAVASADRGAVG